MLIRRSEFAKLRVNRPLVIYEDGRVVTLEQFAQEQSHALDPPLYVEQTKNAFEFLTQKTFFVRRFTNQVKKN